MSSYSKLQWISKDSNDKIEPKDLSKFSTDQEFINNCIIFDDSPAVWKPEYHDRIIPSKKFMPFYKDEVTQMSNNNYAKSFYNRKQKELLFQSEFFLLKFNN